MSEPKKRCCKECKHYIRAGTGFLELGVCRLGVAEKQTEPPARIIVEVFTIERLWVSPTFGCNKHEGWPHVVQDVPEAK